LAQGDRPIGLSAVLALAKIGVQRGQGAERPAIYTHCRLAKPCGWEILLV